MPGVQHLLDDFLVARHAPHLVEGAFVVVQLEPVHAVQDGLYRFRRGAFHVGVLDAQDEGAAVLACISPGEQRGARAADVQVSGGAGGKTGADGHISFLVRREMKPRILRQKAKCDKEIDLGYHL